MHTTAYNRRFLAEQGYFARERTGTASVDGEAETFVFDPGARLAYLEGVAPDRQQAVVGDLRPGRPFDYYWFWNPSTQRVAVYSRYGEHSWFVYDHSRASGGRDRKRRKLADVADGLDVLFDARDVVERLYRDLWTVRLDIARSFEPPAEATIDDEARLLTAQRVIDRLIFCCFLVEEDVVHGVDGGGSRFSLDPGELFERVLQEGSFDEFLSVAFFDHLNATGWTEYEVSETLSIAFPYLNGGLFRNHQVPTESGDEVRERELLADAFDWGTLVRALDEYDWIIEQSPGTGTAPDRLSPAVLGHIFEKFVITVGELSDEESVTLAQLEAMDVSEDGDGLLQGNRKVGAYYTPNYVACENTREALWNGVRQKLAARTDAPAAEIPGADEFFERFHGDADGELPVDPETLEEVLSSLTVLDPSVGSGAFLTTAGEILEGWRRTCLDGASRYEIRRDIVVDSLYGVDLLDGAVEVCKLRLWLWLLSANPIDLQGGQPGIEPLPNVDANLRQGNGLVGVATPGADGAGFSDLDFDWVDGERTTYPEAVEAYRETVEAYRSASGDRAERLRERLATHRRRLREELDGVYARRRDVLVEEGIDSYGELGATMGEVAGPVKLNLDFDSAMTEAERRQVSEAGFREQRNWQTTAYHADAREADPDAIESIFSTMDGRGSISIERPLDEADVAALEPFHWVFEFPTAYDPADGVAFDVVVGNPPHGSELGEVERSVLEDAYDLTEGGREVAKLFTERGWALSGGELSYVVPKPSTYNSNWEDFRRFCLDGIRRGVDLGKAFGNVDHEQVTVHLSRDASGEAYLCGRLDTGSYHLDDPATVDRAFASRLGTLPVGFSAEEQAVAAGLSDTEYPTLGDLGVEAGRGASTSTRSSDPSAPAAYNGRQVQRYFTRSPEDGIEPTGVSNAARRRIETPKLMAQNIIAHRKHPYDHVLIASLYDPVGVYDFETVTNVVLPEGSRFSYPSLSVLLNTQFVNWFVYYVLFNRAIRDMHLDSYFLEHIVVPKELSDADRSVLEGLYGLLAVSNTAAEYETLPEAVETYGELQSIASAVTYELYLRDATARPLETDLVGSLAGVLERHETAYLEWYSAHLESGSEREIVDRFDEGLLRTARDVVEALRTEPIATELSAIAAHPWVQTIERGRHTTEGDSRPTFGPTEIP